jgi:hypothetical protein
MLYCVLLLELIHMYTKLFDIINVGLCVVDQLRINYYLLISSLTGKIEL